MFTGIIKEIGKVLSIENQGTSKIFSIESGISGSMKIDESISHDGVCLTVTEVSERWHKVCAIEKTLELTTLNKWSVGTLVNLEQAMLMSARLDGHLVQGHVDGTATCTRIEERDGSWQFYFEHNAPHILVDEGSVCLNGVSLTVVKPTKTSFHVCIIPYTYEHTTFKSLKLDDLVNIEFDIIGKYIGKYMEAYRTASGTNLV
jgi:riboflavin synthase